MRAQLLWNESERISTGGVQGDKIIMGDESRERKESGHFSLPRESPREL